MTAIEVVSQDLQKIEHLIRMKYAQLDRVLEQKRLILEEEGALRTALTHLDNKKYGLLNGKQI